MDILTSLGFFFYNLISIRNNNISNEIDDMISEWKKYGSQNPPVERLEKIYFFVFQRLTVSIKIIPRSVSSHYNDSFVFCVNDWPTNLQLSEFDWANLIEEYIYMCP